MLSTGTTRAIGIDPQIVRINLHIQIFFNIRHDITGNERGLTLASRVERGNTDQTMDAFLRFQVAVGIFAVDLQGDGLKSRLVAIQEIKHLGRKALFVRPALVHTIQHTAPVHRLGTTRARVQLEDRVAAVVLAGQECLCAEFFQFFDELI